MFETASDLSDKHNKSENIDINNEPLSLPNIGKKPASRGEPTSRHDLSQK